MLEERKISLVDSIIDYQLKMFNFRIWYQLEGKLRLKRMVSPREAVLLPRLQLWTLMRITRQGVNLHELLE